MLDEPEIDEMVIENYPFAQDLSETSHQVKIWKEEVIKSLNETLTEHELSVKIGYLSVHPQEFKSPDNMLDTYWLLMELKMKLDLLVKSAKFLREEKVRHHIANLNEIFQSQYPFESPFKKVVRDIQKWQTAFTKQIDEFVEREYEDLIE